MKIYNKVLMTGVLTFVFAFLSTAMATDSSAGNQSCGVQSSSALFTVSSLGYWRQCETDSDCGSGYKCCHKAESDGNGTRCRSKSVVGNCTKPKSN